MHSKRWAVRTLGVAVALWCTLLPLAGQNAPGSTPSPLPPLKLPDVGPPDEDDPDPLPGENAGVPGPTITSTPLPIPPGPPIVKADLPQNHTYVFRTEYDGRLVGYSLFEVTGSMALGGESNYIIKSASRLKLGVGAPDDSRFTGKLMVDTKKLTPSYYMCEQKAQGGSFLVECLYSASLIAQKNKSGEHGQDHFHSYTGETPRLLFNNLWGHFDTFPEHYWLLVRSAIKGGTLEAYDPILRGGGKLVVYAPRAEKWTNEGQTYDTLVYPISDMEGTLMANVRVGANSYDLLEVQEIGRGLVMRRSKPDVVAQVEKLKPLDLLSRRVVPSNVIFPDPEKLTSVEAEIDLNLRGGQFADHRIPGYRQYFSGDLQDGVMKGRVVVRSVPRDVNYVTKYPYRTADKPPAEMANYIKPGPGVESDFPPLINKAMELAWKSENTYQAARRLMNFCEKIEEGVSLPSARYAMESGVGNPESKALLMVAMARAVGLPARRVGGLLFRDGSFLPHHWAEVWLGPTEGWAPFDPTTGEAGRVGATHIALWESGDIQRMSLRVTNYAPRAPRKVAFFNRELNWGVGEERHYDILREGKRIGKEIAAIREILVKNEDDVYRFEANTSMGEENPVLTNSELLVDTKGLPVNFSLKGLKGKFQDQNYSFLQDTARLEIDKGDGKKEVRDIPFSYGTYFTDQRFLSQWALVIGQALDPNPANKLKAGEKITFFTFVPETQKSQEVVLEVKEPETIKLPTGEEVTATRLESESGMAFYVNDKNQVVKIAVPRQKLELVLTETRFDKVQ